MVAQHTFELMGGLGNQLFQVAAASRLTPQPILDLSMIRPPFLKHKTGPMSFAEGFKTKDLYNQFGKTGWRLFNSARIAAHRLSGQDYLRNSVVLSQSTYDTSFFDNLSQSESKMLVRGYFQDLRYLPFKPNTLESQSWQISLNHRSMRYLESLEEQWCALHVRLGDFVELGHSPKRSYFKDALSRVVDESPVVSKVVMFSDDPDVAENLIKPLVDRVGLEFSRAPQMEDPEQAMALMSRANCQIISNSTFSWWAAATNTPASKIYCPRVWSDLLVTNIIPENWNRV